MTDAVSDALDWALDRLNGKLPFLDHLARPVHRLRDRDPPLALRPSTQSRLAGVRGLLV
jgi:hypothetical protein